ncbi:MAG TPA: DUF3052 family protein [Propionibacteriaceae bacterium]|nr:DUF3052 family protein [Propionibacteriaceae bacterium]
MKLGAGWPSSSVFDAPDWGRLTDAGYIWLMTPKVGRSGYVDAADLAEAAVTAGLALTNSVPVSSDWTATKLVRPRGSRR